MSTVLVVLAMTFVVLVGLAVVAALALSFTACLLLLAVEGVAWLGSRRGRTCTGDELARARALRASGRSLRRSRAHGTRGEPAAAAQPSAVKQARLHLGDRIGGAP